MLPILMPFSCQRCIILGLSLGLRRDPFVRVTTLPFIYLVRGVGGHIDYLRSIFSNSPLLLLIAISIPP